MYEDDTNNKSRYYYILKTPKLSPFVDRVYKINNSIYNSRFYGSDSNITDNELLELTGLLMNELATVNDIRKVNLSVLVDNKALSFSAGKYVYSDRFETLNSKHKKLILNSLLSLSSGISKTISTNDIKYYIVYSHIDYDGFNTVAVIYLLTKTGYVDLNIGIVDSYNYINYALTRDTKYAKGYYSLLRYFNKVPSDIFTRLNDMDNSIIYNVLPYYRKYGVPI